jgi:hypothetical protein
MPTPFILERRKKVEANYRGMRCRLERRKKGKIGGGSFFHLPAVMMIIYPPLLFERVFFLFRGSSRFR